MKCMRILALSSLLLPAAASAQDGSGYPTLDRVDYVLTCMAEHGGQNIDNLYACSCHVDVVAQQMSFDEYTEARTYEQYKRMPGDKGGIFRDSDRGEELLKKVNDARAEADKRCFISKRAAASKAAGEAKTP